MSWRAKSLDAIYWTYFLSRYLLNHLAYHNVFFTNVECTFHDEKLKELKKIIFLRFFFKFLQIHEFLQLFFLGDRTDL